MIGELSGLGNMVARSPLHGTKEPRLLDCIVATYSGIPSLDPDDRLLLDALRQKGMRVGVGVWNDRSVDWSKTRLCLLRSIWDYPQRYERFANWLQEIEKVTVVRNTPDLVRWNSHKSYLRDLACAGVPVVPTAWVRRGETVDLTAVLKTRGWPDAVVKPATGSAALNVLRVSLSVRRAGQKHLDELLENGDVLVQPYLSGLETYPERSLIFINGDFSHAVVKEPFDTKLAIGNASNRLVDPTNRELAIAEAAVSVLPGGAPLYARVDLFPGPTEQIFVNEVELIEPALYLSAYPHAANALADAISRQLSSD